MIPSLRLSQKALILVAVPLIFEFIFVGILCGLLQHAESEARKEAHLKAVIAETNAILHNCLNSAMSIYLYKATQQKSYKEHYEELCAAIPVRMNTLKELVADSPGQSASLERITKMANKGTVLMNEALTMAEESDQSGGYLDLKSEIEAVSVEMLTELRKFAKEEEKADDFNPENQTRSRQLVQAWIASGLAINVVLALALALYFNRGTTQRLNTVVNNTFKMARGQELLTPLEGTDEIAQLDRTFHDMAKALKEADEYKKQLIGVVSHELRSPLTSIQAALTMLSSGYGGKLEVEGEKLVDVACKSSTRLIRLINDLLDYEKMEAGKMQIDPTNIAIEDVLDRSLSAVAQLLEAKEIDLDMAGTNLMAFADADRLVQVLVNLLSNAIKFSPERSTIKVEVEDCGQEVEVRVTDQGRGIPPHLLNTIFDRFSQVSGSDSKKGTGLGLPICKSIIEGHNGTIGVRSEMNKGSTFWFRVPSSSSRSALVET